MTYDEEIAKVSIVGAGMRAHDGHGGADVGALGFCVEINHGHGSVSLASLFRFRCRAGNLAYSAYMVQIAHS